MISTILILLNIALVSCQDNASLKSGAERIDHYLPILEGKALGVVANHTSVVGNAHLVDTLLSRGIPLDHILKVFAPEHGFRGEAAAGVPIEDAKDAQTGISVVSLYGPNKKPKPEVLNGIELMVFDLQDVGARFYTYISTLHYVMEACAENNIPLIVLDRPNPNGGYVDGPLLDPAYTTFVGMHPIPVVYGLTMGELAQMINGEGWLLNSVKCQLTVIPCEGYRHGTVISLPVSPSPNLGNDHAVRMYPSTCFFEGTVLSEGRGTPAPFEAYGHPDMPGSFSFTPEEIPGVARTPKFEGQLCHGEDLRDKVPEEGWIRIQLQWLLDAYHSFPRKDEFFTSYFDKLAGTDALRIQIEAGWSEKQIRASWEEDLQSYMAKRSNYLIYEESELYEP